jgi:hypothetical protein
MSGLLLRVSATALPRRAVVLHLAAALVLLAMASPAMDSDDGALLVLRGTAVLLATALALAVDEPSAQLLDATPTTLLQRLAARTAVCAVLVLPVWLLALSAATTGGADIPLGAVTLELAALVALGLAVPLCLRRWRGMTQPAPVVGPVLLGALIAAGHLPERLQLLPFSPDDPSWDAAHLRWGGVLLLAAALVAAAAGDPATASSRRWRRRGCQVSAHL